MLKKDVLKRRMPRIIRKEELPSKRNRNAGISGRGRQQNQLWGGERLSSGVERMRNHYWEREAREGGRDQFLNY